MGLRFICFPNSFLEVVCKFCKLKHLRDHKIEMDTPNTEEHRRNKTQLAQNDKITNPSR